MVDPISAKPNAPVAQGIAAVAPAKAAPTAKPVASGEGDAANPASLTSVARQLAATPPIDYERIALIRSAIAKGNFPIYPAEIADRLIALKLDWNPHESS